MPRVVGSRRVLRGGGVLRNRRTTARFDLRSLDYAAVVAGAGWRAEDHFPARGHRRNHGMGVCGIAEFDQDGVNEDGGSK